MAAMSWRLVFPIHRDIVLYRDRYIYRISNQPFRIIRKLFVAKKKKKKKIDVSNGERIFVRIEKKKT